MARIMIEMTAKEVRSFLAEQRTAVFGSMGPDGFAHLVAMWYIPVDGALVLWTYAKSQKARNLERDPRVSVLVEAGERYDELRGVLIRAEAELIRDPARVLDTGRELHLRYHDTPLTDAEPGIRAQASKRMVVRVPLTRVTSWDHRKIATGKP